MKPNQLSDRLVLPFFLTAILALFIVFAAQPAAGQNTAPAAFGSGLDLCPVPLAPVTPVNPRVVTDCTRAGLQAALDLGGHITFACGPAPVTIPIDQTLVTNGQTTILDGGGLVTLDGQSQVKILEKPYTTAPNTLTVQNIRFANGRAPDDPDLTRNSGSAITLGHPGSRLHVINATFDNNATRATSREDNQGGAIFVSNAYETIIVGSTFRHNTAGNGGAFGGIATGLLIYNSRFEDNEAADSAGGGIVRGYGGAIHLDGVRNGYNPDSRHEVTVCGSIFAHNRSVRGGGAFSSVVSDGYGTKATFARSTFIGNEVIGLNGEYGQGGALYHIEDDLRGGRSEDNFEIDQSTFFDNRALRQGGAVWFQVLGQGRILNSTFYQNTTTAPFNAVGQGGAMMITRGVIDIVNATFSQNHAAYQGGALHAGGDGDPDRVVTLRNTIFANNTLNEQTEPSETRWQGYHTNRPMADSGQNIQFPRYKPTYGNDVNNWITANPIFADPLLAPPANNGGYNDTLALLAGSPAIDAGAAGCPAVDQRGAPRSGPCDIGAYEFGGVPPHARRLDLSAAVTDLDGTLPYTRSVALDLRLENEDTAPAAGITLSLTLPAAVDFGGWIEQPAGATLDGRTLRWGPGSLAPGAAVRLLVVLDLAAPAGTPVTLTARFATTAGDGGSAAAGFTIGDPPRRRLYLPAILR